MLGADLGEASVQASSRVLSHQETNGPPAATVKTKRQTVDLSPQKANGVLAVHLKELRIFNAEFLKLFDHDQVNIYLRIISGGNVKSSCAHPCPLPVPASITLDDMKHFYIQINPFRGHTDNALRLELVAYERRDVHRIISRKVIQKHDLIENQFVVDTCRFVRSEKVVAEVEAEFCFAYGCFGYGYSNQLENQFVQPEDQISHSMFCRFPAPENRCKGKTAPDIMTPLPVGHPAFINFTGKVDLVDLKMEFGSDTDLQQTRIIEEPIILISKMRKKLHLLHKEYGSQTSRKNRIMYLRTLIRNEHLLSDHHEEISLSRGVHLKRRSAKLLQEEDQGTSTETEGVSSNLTEIEKIIAAAPGVQKTRTEKQKSSLEEVAVEQGSFQELAAVTKQLGELEDEDEDDLQEMQDVVPRRRSTWGRISGMWKNPFSLLKHGPADQEGRRQSKAGPSDSEGRRLSKAGPSDSEGRRRSKAGPSDGWRRKSKAGQEERRQSKDTQQQAIHEDTEEEDDHQDEEHKVSGRKRSTFMEIARFLFTGDTQPKHKVGPAKDRLPRVMIIPPTPQPSPHASPSASEGSDSGSGQED